MTNEELIKIVEEIKATKNSIRITPRELINALGYERRTSGNIWNVDAFLGEHQLEVSEDYTIGWVDRPIELRHKAVAVNKIKKDPIKKISVLDAARRVPLTINNDAPLKDAISKMLLNNYSQLPVISGPKNCIGYISWETIGQKLVCGEVDLEAMVKDYVNQEIAVIKDDTPLLKAIKQIYEHDFAVVVNNARDICGLVTTYDISSTFLEITEPFLLLEQIETKIRQLLGGKILLEHIQELCKDEDRRVQWIDDLTFGEYLEILKRPEYWEKLQLKVTKNILIEQLDNVRKIRNRIMHFEPEGIRSEDVELLKRTADFLNRLDL